ncbi:hypothetical protein BJX66DRAFT_312893 [Aspergillus keveii]|uniref:C2H2-type domain-containing protein n=1 Tax=Aspergillus keveii TaxID=714993 RepID=A0ABR4FSZ1_9EURO
MKCIACPEVLASWDEWVSHVREHEFEEGFVCPSPSCHKLIREKETLTPIKHYWEHNVDIDDAITAFSNLANHHCPWVGRTWCGNCMKCSVLKIPLRLASYHPRQSSILRLTLRMRAEPRP